MKRNKQLDLLRVISIWFILTIHFLGWGEAVNTLTIHDYNFWWMMPVYFAGQAGNTLFFMLSGYFAGKPRFEKAILLERKAAFYSTILTWPVFLIGGVSLSYAVHAMFPLLFKKYWFVSVYLMLYGLELLLVPGIQSLSKKQYHVVLFVLLLNNTIVTDASYTLLEGLMAFLIGAYIKRYEPFTSKSSKQLFFIYAIIMAAFGTERVLAMRLNAEHTRVDMNLRYVLILAAATMLFGGVQNLNVRLNIWSIISPHILAIYLISANPAITGILYEKVLRVSGLCKKIWFLPYYIAMNVLILLLCVGIDILTERIHLCETDVWIRCIAKCKQRISQRKASAND